MSEGEALPWSPIDWSDEDGGTIRLWPHLPTVVSTDALRRTVGDWQGLAFLLPPDEPEDWAEQVVEERDNPGVNRDTLAYQGGAYGRMMEGLISIDSVSSETFEDPRHGALSRSDSPGDSNGPWGCDRWIPILGVVTWRHQTSPCRY